MQVRQRAIAASLIAVTAVVCAGQEPFGNAFTYQGMLRQNGQPLSGQVSLVFDLFTAPEGGSSLGTVSLPDQPVINGLFTALLDFGAEPFRTGEARWLQVTVNQSPPLPRQRLTGVPFSLSTRGINVDSAGRVGIGTSAPQARLHVDTSSGGEIRFSKPNAGTQTLRLDPAGGATNQQIVMERSPADQLAVSSFFTAYGLLGTAAKPLLFGVNGRSQDMVIAAGGNIGIGTGAPQALLHLRRTSSLENLRIDSPDHLGYVTFSGAGIVRGYLGFGAAGNLFFDQLEGAMALRGESGLQLGTGGMADLTITQDGQVGIGTTTPTSKLTVAGTVETQAIKFPDGSVLTTATGGGGLAAGFRGSQVFDEPGTRLWAAPQGVTAVLIEAVGAGGGGGGGGSRSGGANGGGGGGGGAGGYWRAVVSVVPGEVYTVVVGAGGAAGPGGQPPTRGSDAGPGGATRFIRQSGTVLIHCEGGSGGQGGSPGAAQVGGLGGSGGNGGQPDGRPAYKAPGGAGEQGGDGVPPDDDFGGWGGFGGDPGGFFGLGIGGDGGDGGDPSETTGYDGFDGERGALIIQW